MKIYQDKEETSLYGRRTRKDSVRIGVIGTLDELNSFVGLAVSRFDDGEIKQILKEVQRNLFVAGADVATPFDITEKHERISLKEVTKVEETISRLESELEPLNKFILPGGSREAAVLHICRTICRRAERSIVALKMHEEINHFVFVYINRLSDLLFTLARLANQRKGVNDEEWL